MQPLATPLGPESNITSDWASPGFVLSVLPVACILGCRFQAARFVFCVVREERVLFEWHENPGGSDRGSSTRIAAIR